MRVAGARDVAGAARAGPGALQLHGHCRQHLGVLAHAEVVVRAPHGDLGADAVVEGARKAAAAPFEIGEDPVASLGMERIEARLEEIVEVHGCDSRSELRNDSTLAGLWHGARCRGFMPGFVQFWAFTFSGCR